MLHLISTSRVCSPSLPTPFVLGPGALLIALLLFAVANNFLHDSLPHNVVDSLRLAELFPQTCDFGFEHIHLGLQRNSILPSGRRGLDEEIVVTKESFGGVHTSFVFVNLYRAQNINLRWREETG